MIETLKKINEFTIATPVKAGRQIFFADPFTDSEFDEYRVTNNILELLKDGKVLATLEYDNGIMMGKDVRGGYSQISPPQHQQTQFSKAFKTNRKVVLAPNTQKVETQKVMLISPIAYAGYQHVNAKGRLYDIYEKLFSSGAEIVLNINIPIEKPAVDLLVNLSKRYLSDDVASIQVCSQKTGAANEISEETGEFKCFSINQRTWLKIKEKMKDHTYNFQYNLKTQFKEKRLKRLSTNMSRDRQSTIQDSRRSKFIEV